MDDTIFKKPEPSPVETFFHLSYSAKSEAEMLALVESMSTEEDREMLTVINKKCRYREVRVAAGRIIYYNHF